MELEPAASVVMRTVAGVVSSVVVVVAVWSCVAGCVVVSVVVVVVTWMEQGCKRCKLSWRGVYRSGTRDSPSPSFSCDVLQTYTCVRGFTCTAGSGGDMIKNLEFQV